MSAIGAPSNVPWGPQPGRQPPIGSAPHFRRLTRRRSLPEPDNQQIGRPLSWIGGRRTGRYWHRRNLRSAPVPHHLWREAVLYEDLLLHAKRLKQLRKGHQKFHRTGSFQLQERATRRGWCSYSSSTNCCWANSHCKSIDRRCGVQNSDRRDRGTRPASDLHADCWF